MSASGRLHPRSLRHLQDAVVLLELADEGQLRCSAEAYRCAAANLRALVWAELRRVPVQDFHATFDVLQVTADNLYFESRGRFAEQGDGGQAAAAQQACEALLARLGARRTKPCEQR